jgi:uncharacterized membrane protein (DUF485 family)
MAEEHDWQEIERFPEYGELRRMQRHFLIPASVIYLAGYFGFLIVAGSAASLLRGRVHGGLTVGFLLMACVFLLVWVTVGVYVRVANHRWEAQISRVSSRERART